MEFSFISIFKKISHASKECKKIAHFMLVRLVKPAFLHTLQHNLIIKINLQQQQLTAKIVKRISVTCLRKFKLSSVEVSKVA